MMNRHFASIVVLCLGFSSFALSAAPLKKLALLDRVVATVNKDSITESELERQTQLLLVRLQQTDAQLPPIAVLRKQLLEKMIMEKLQLQLASEEGIEIDETTLSNALGEIAKRDSLSLTQLQQFIEDQGIPFDQFRETIKTEMTLSKVQQKQIGQQISISAADVENFLNSPAGQDQTGAEYRIGHILIPLPETPASNIVSEKKQLTEKLVKELKSGSDFSRLAISHSAGQQALNGGDLGWRKSPEIPSLFSKIVPTLQVNDTYGPIRDSSGFHIVKLLDKRLLGSEGASKTQLESQVRQILVKTNAKRSDEEAKTLLTQLRTQIENGTPFTTLAQKYSDENNSAAKGGDIGWVSDNRVVPEFKQHLGTLKTGELSQPFKTAMGWHLIQVIKQRSRQASSDAMRSKAMDILYQRKFEELLVSSLRRIREEAQVDIYLNES